MLIYPVFILRFGFGCKVCTVILLLICYLFCPSNLSIQPSLDIQKQKKNVSREEKEIDVKPLALRGSLKDAQDFV